MPLYRGGFFKKGSSETPPVEPTRRVARSEAMAKPRPTPAGGPVVTVPATPARDRAPIQVVGWLVVVEGPGRGEVLPLGYGVNDIGRGADARVRLDFGDATIDSRGQAAVIYTARSRRFYLQSIASGNWVDSCPVVDKSVELTGGETLRMGQTRLRFVPLCGPGFDWREGQ
ncbi:MAG: FHA domain-containing protein [Candidatus Competibacter sp.]|nr:FHA domain-containing protein [Candidatus Competibacter sp.]MDG4583608.1 FHA domain-containing protein [Candidatus Competibacter sp.]